MEQVKTQPRPATAEELQKLREMNTRYRAEQLKRLQTQWDWEDRSGETEDAIEQDRERRRKE